MPYKTGSVSQAFNKAVANEVSGTGDGLNMVFGFTVLKPTLILSSYTLKYTIGTVQYTATCVGGVLSGTYISSGTVTEAGVVSVTFLLPLDSLSQLLSSYTSKGIVQELIDFCCSSAYTEGLTTSNQIDYTVTLANPTVAKGQCRIRFKIGGTEKEVWDDGEGGFVHSDVDFDNSSIVYASGAVVLKFKQAIDTGYTVAAFYTNGSTEGRDWLIMRNTTSKKSDGTDAFSGLLLQELVIKNSNINYKDFVCLGLRENQYITGSCYNVALNFYPEWTYANESSIQSWNSNSSWSGVTGYDTTYQAWNTYPQLLLKDDQMTYWFSVTKGTIIIVVKISNTVYMTIYMGTYRRMCSPSKLKYPIVIIGNSRTLSHNTASSSTTSPITTGSTNIFFVKHTTNVIQKFDISYFHRLDPVTQNVSKQSTPMDKIRTTNQIPLIPIYLVQDSNIGVLEWNNYGELNRLYYVINKDIRVEDVIQVGAVNYLVVQDVNRTSQYDYFLVELS